MPELTYNFLICWSMGPVNWKFYWSCNHFLWISFSFYPCSGTLYSWIRTSCCFLRVTCVNDLNFVLKVEWNLHFFRQGQKSDRINSDRWIAEYPRTRKYTIDAILIQINDPSLSLPPFVNLLHVGSLLTCLISISSFTLACALLTPQRKTLFLWFAIFC